MLSNSLSHTQSWENILHIHQHLVLQVCFREAAQAPAQHGLTCSCWAEHGMGNMKKSHCSSVSAAWQGILTKSIHPATLQALLETRKVCVTSINTGQQQLSFLLGTGYLKALPISLQP